MVGQFDYRIDGEPFTSDFPMDRRSLFHCAALALYHAEPTFGLDSTVSVTSHNPFEGAGTLHARQVLEWVLTDEGKESLRKEPASFLPYLEHLASGMLGR